MQSQWVDVMKRKRAIHEEVINKVRQQRSGVPAPEVKLFYMYHLLFRCSRSVPFSCFQNANRKPEKDRILYGYVM